MPALATHRVGGVTLLGDLAIAGGVAFAFTERGGGVSSGPYASLNLGALCGDDPSCVSENRRRALAALGAEGVADRLVSPRQVHGDHVVAVRSAAPDALAAARAEGEAGADAVVVTAPNVPVLMCFADCVPVVLAAPGGFAVIHSGWRGTIARICAKAVRVLCEEAFCEPASVRAYVGPHIGAADYEVSEELAERFSREFGTSVVPTPRHLDLAACVRMTLEAEGVAPEAIFVVGESTATTTDRFFSYRASGGSCGRHAALALMRGPAGTEGQDDDERGRCSDGS